MFTCKKKAAEIMKKNWGNLLLSAVITGAVALIPIVGLILFAPVKLGLLESMGDLSKDEKFDIRKLYSKFKTQFGPSFLLLVLSGVWIAVAVIVIGIVVAVLTNLLRAVGIIVGLILALAASFYLSLWLDMSWYVLYREPGLDGHEALNKGRSMAAGHLGEYIGLTFSFIGWFLLVLVTFGLSLVHTLPYMNMTFFLFFSELYNGPAPAAVPVTPAAPVAPAPASPAPVAPAAPAPAAPAAPAETAPRDGGFVFCTKCGHKNSNGFAFCEKCGSRLEM